MRVTYIFVVGSMAASAIALACGSSGDSDLILPAGDAGGADGASSSSSGSTGSGGPREAGAGGVTADGGIDPPNAAPGGDTTQVACGSASCPIPAETCCVSDTPNGLAYACVAGATCPQATGGGNTTALKCTSSANCGGGTVCCVTQNNGTTSSECKTTCTNTGGGDTAQLCDPAKADAGGCPTNAPCSNDNIGDWGLPNTFGTCGGRGN